jgi:HSP20 family protein
MELIRWNPTRDLFDLRGRFNSLFNDFFMPGLKSETQEGLWNWNPAVDVMEDDNNMIVKAELPGVEKDKINVELNGRMLTIKGERSAETETKEEKYYRKESMYGQFERSVALPAEVDPESIKARYKDGILTVQVPKPEDAKPKKISVH